MFMSGGSRGIGLAIALRAARDGAKVALMAKTAEPHPKLPGTVFTAAEEIEAAGGEALPIVGDIRDAEAAGRDPASIKHMIEIKVSYDRDPERAITNTHPWAALALEPEQKEGIEDPIEMERVADANLEQAPRRFICSADPEEVVEQIAVYVELGFEELQLHAPGTDQLRFLEEFSADVLPLLRDRFPT